MQEMIKCGKEELSLSLLSVQSLYEDNQLTLFVEKDIPCTGFTKINIR